MVFYIDRGGCNNKFGLYYEAKILGEIRKILYFIISCVSVFQRILIFKQPPNKKV